MIRMHEGVDTQNCCKQLLLVIIHKHPIGRKLYKISHQLMSANALGYYTKPLHAWLYVYVTYRMTLLKYCGGRKYKGQYHTPQRFRYPLRGLTCLFLYKVGSCHCEVSGECCQVGRLLNYLLFAILTLVHWTGDVLCGGRMGPWLGVSC